MSRFAALLIAPLLLLPACSGDEGGDGGGGPEEALAAAREQLDETPGVRVSLTTEELPDGVDGVLEATGVGTHAPAFEGDITVVVNSLEVDVPVVAVEGVVHAQLPFTDSYAEIDPADYGAPDPAALLDTEGGISGWLTQAQDVTEGDQVRDGEQVLTTYDATVPGEAVAAVIPSADETAAFETSFRLDDDDRLVGALITGPFYGDAGPVEYELTLDDYGTDEEITAP